MLAKNLKTPLFIEPMPSAQLTTDMTTMFMAMTMKRKEVPQRACRREHFITFSAVRGRPFS